MKPQPYRRTAQPTRSASVTMQRDCHDAVVKYAAAQKPPLSISGAIHKLLRTHPEISLPDLQ